MKYILITLVILLFCSCEKNYKSRNKNMHNSTVIYNIFDQQDHLQPDFDQSTFDTLHSWDFGWAVLSPINIATDNNENEKLLARRLSPGQKALYFFWYLDEEVTNGGFIQFYWNGYRKYLPPIIDGLKLIGDTEMLNLVEKADSEYIKNKALFDLQRRINDWEPLYNKLKAFDKFDKKYYKIHDNTMVLIEKYARRHTTEFVKLR